MNKARQALALFESFEWIDCESESHTQPTPEPPAAPDPGPGWRLIELGEVIPPYSQYKFHDGTWKFSDAVGAIHNRSTLTYRAPIFHNPVNLESAGDGYRFCLVSETRQDATHCFKQGDVDLWSSMECSKHDGVTGFQHGYTYRTNKPLQT